MDIENIREILNEFTNGQEWSRIRETQLRSMGATSYWIIDNEGSFVFKETQDKEGCQNVKSTSLDYENCQAAFLYLFYETKKRKRSIINKCHLKYITFSVPLMAENEVVGIVGGCQIESPAFMGKKERLISSSVIRAPQVKMVELLEKEVELLAIHCQSALDLIIKDRKLLEKEREIKDISLFYEIMEGERDKILSLDPNSLFRYFLSIISRIIKGQVYVLMLYNQAENELEIKMSLEEDGSLVSSSRVSIDKDIAEYVIKTKEPMLVKNIGQDERLANQRTINQYYTKSFLITPLMLQRKLIGVISINSELTHHIFNESELRVLQLICGYITVAIESSLLSYQEMKTKFNLEKEASQLKEGAHKIKTQTDALRQQIVTLSEQIEETVKLKKETEELKIQADKIENQTLFTKRFLELQTLEVATQEEETITLKRETEALSKQVEKYLSEEKTTPDITTYTQDLKRQTKKLYQQAGKLFSQVEMLKNQLREAEELLSKVKEVEELDSQTQQLKEQADTLRSQVDKLQNKADNLIVQAKEAEAIIAAASDMEKGKDLAEELNLLAEISSQMNKFKKPEEILNWVLLKIQPLFNSNLGAFLYAKGRILSINILYQSETSEKLLEEMKSKLLTTWSEIKSESMANKRVICNLSKESSWGTSLEDQEQIESFLIIPFNIKDREVGLLVLASSKKDFFGLEKKRFFSCLSNYLSLAVENNVLKEKTLSEIDELTKVYDHHYLKLTLDSEVKRAEFFNHNLSMILVDVDHLAKINNHYGYLMGNKVLINIAKTLKKNIKKIGFVARYGSDHFVLVLPETREDEAYQVAQKIKSEVSATVYHSKDSKFGITVNIGLVSYSDLIKDKTVPGLFKAVNKALLRAKHSRKNEVEIYRDNNHNGKT